jgi:hypothetical protein
MTYSCSNARASSKAPPNALEVSTEFNIYSSASVSIAFVEDPTMGALGVYSSPTLFLFFEVVFSFSLLYPNFAFAGMKC